MQLINGRLLAEKIKDEVVKEIAGNKPGDALLSCPRPNLAIILAGNRPDSELYVSLKEREAKKCGIDTHLYRCDDDATEEQLSDIINFLNRDETIDGILLQLPLPGGLDADKIVAMIDPKKDVDGFHPENLKILMGTCDHEQFLPPVFAVVLEMLKSIKYDPRGEQVCIVNNSDIFSQGLAKVLECKGAKTTIVKADDEKLTSKTKEADILITAVGKPSFIDGDMIKKGAIIIDIGISKEDDKICGDVDADKVDDMASFLSPVPGGVGPMTIACALKNTVRLWQERNKGGA